MKKIVLPFFSCLLVFTMLLDRLVTPMLKSAMTQWSPRSPGYGVQHRSDGPLLALPGTIELANLMSCACRLPEGEAQFEGAGHTRHQVRCRQSHRLLHHQRHSMGLGRQSGRVGWHQVGVAADPTIKTYRRRRYFHRRLRNNITGNGTYAFIKYITEPDKLPTMGACTDNPQILMLLMEPGDGPLP